MSLPRVRPLLLVTGLVVLLIWTGVVVDASSTNQTENLPAPSLTQVSLQLPWKHQFEFAGFYAAIQQGFYRARGLAVDLREYAPGLDMREAVRSGEATFGLTNGQVIDWRLRGEPVVLLANYFKKPPLVLLARSGLHRLADLRDGRLMAAADDLRSPLLSAALREAGLTPGEHLTIVPQTFDAGPLIRGDIDAMTAFVTNDPFDLENKGIPFQIIELGGYLPGLGDSYLFTAEATAREQPEQVRAFVEASNAGWAYALAHPDALVELIHTQYASGRSRAALRYEAARTRELMQTELLPIGSLSQARIELAAAAMLESGIPGAARHLEGAVFHGAAPETVGSTPPAPTEAPGMPGAASPPPQPTSPTSSLPLSPEQRAWLAAHPRIRYTQWNDRTPVEYLDDAGKPHGMSTDYLIRVARDLGLQLEFVPTANWTEALAQLRAGDIDLLPSAVPTAKRRDYLAFTQGYLSLPIAIFAPLHAPFYGDLEALRGQRVAVIGGTATEDWLRRDHPKLELISLADAATGVQVLEQGRADAFVDSLLTFSHVIGRDGPPRLRMAGTTPYRFSLAMAVRRDLAPLADILDVALSAMPQSARDSIQHRWLQMPATARIDYRLLWQVLGVAALLIAVILYWNRRLARAHRLLRESQARFQRLVEDIGPQFVIYSRRDDGTLEYVSQGAEAVFGIPHTGAVGKNLLELIDWTPESRVQLIDNARHMQATGEHLTQELDFHRADGALATVLVTSRPQAAHKGTHWLVEGIAEDITERKAIERGLQLSTARYEDMVRLIPVGIYTLRQRTGEPETLEYLSPRGAEILGLNKGELRPYLPEAGAERASVEQLFERVHPEDRDSLVQTNRATVREDFFWEGRILVQGATRWCRLESVAESQDEDWCLWQGVISDITAQKEAEQALIQARQVAEAANRTKSDFLANMSHEIRTPMNAVLSMMHLCLETKLTPTQRDYLHRAQRAAQALLALLNDILDLSKVEAGQMLLEQAPFALSTVLNDLRALVGGQAAAKGLAFDIQRDPEVPEALCGDPLRLGQVLINLTNNAIKFTERGRVDIHVSGDRFAPDRARLHFAVRDTGIGMSAEQVACLFRPFHQADTSITRRYGGTGLGLSICRRLAELMDGDIAVHSQPGEGSVFTLTLHLGLAPKEPAGVAAATAKAEAPAPTPAPDAAAIRAGLPIIAELIALAQALDAEAEEVFCTHQAQLAALLSPEDFATLTRYIGHYQFPQAANLLEQAQQRLQADAAQSS